MSQFVELFAQELIATVEGLTGQAPEVSLDESKEISHAHILFPSAIITVQAQGDVDSNMLVSFSPSIATAVGSLMMGEMEPIAKNTMDDDDLDATKEIVSNILGAFSTSLGSQKTLPKLSFVVENITFEENNSMLSPMDTAYVYSVNVAGVMGQVALMTDFKIESALGNKEPEPTPAKSSSLSNEDIKNISLVRDVQLPVLVRIGSNRMLLKYVLSMDLGSVIELNQLANEPLEILIGDKHIAMGEVVIVDGNFGVQITEIGTKRERLEQLR